MIGEPGFNALGIGDGHQAARGVVAHERRAPGTARDEGVGDFGSV
jgi:hypothetical protein